MTLRAEQEEYEREGIAWKPIPFFNNKVVCDLLDGSKPPGVFRVLDDTCKTMHGTKAGIDINKAENHGASPLYAAAQQGHIEVVNALLARGDIEINKLKSINFFNFY